MNLQEMLGDAFHEGITVDEINTALSGKKFADLSTGNYVDVNKYKADLQAKDGEIQKQAEALHQKMTDDEKKAAAVAEKDDYIKRLEEQVRNQAIDTNRTKAQTLTNDVRTILDIKDGDESYDSFLNTLSNVEGDQSSKVAAYVNKLVKESYEKGKKGRAAFPLADTIGKRHNSSPYEPSRNKGRHSSGGSWRSRPGFNA